MCFNVADVWFVLGRHCREGEAVVDCGSGACGVLEHILFVDFCRSSRLKCVCVRVCCRFALQVRGAYVSDKEGQQPLKPRVRFNTIVYGLPHLSFA